MSKLIVKVLGGGCKNCHILAEEVQKAADEMGIEIDLEKVEEYSAIVMLGVMSTPALIVNGKIQFEGCVKKSIDLKQYLK